MSPASPRARAPGGGWEASGRIRPGWAVLKLPLLARKLWWIRTTGHFEHISEAADAGAGARLSAADLGCEVLCWGLVYQVDRGGIASAATAAGIGTRTAPRATLSAGRSEGVGPSRRVPRDTQVCVSYIYPVTGWRRPPGLRQRSCP